MTRRSAGLSPVPGLRTAWASPTARRATVAAFAAGTAMSAAAPQIGVFLVNDLGASLPTAGWFYLTNLTAPLVGYLVGSRSDRSGNAYGLYRACVLAGSAGYLLVSLSTAVWVPFVVSAAMLGFGAVAVSQLFAVLHDDLSRQQEQHADDLVNVVRMAVTAGWVVGPTLGAGIAATAGLRAVFAAVAMLTAGQLLAFAGRPVSAATTPRSTPETATGQSRPGPLLPLLAFTGLFVLVYAGEPIKFGYLPIYMRNDLGFAASLSGALIGIQPFVELLLMPFTIGLARRVGALPLMSFGALLCVCANICFATTGDAPGLLAGQVLMGGVWGIFATLGLLTAQRLLPGSVATASAIFLTASPVSTALGGLVGGTGVAVLGLPHVFVLPALLALLAAVGLAACPHLRVRGHR